MGPRSFIGVDLAVQAKNTGVVVLDVSGRSARAALPGDGDGTNLSLINNVGPATVVGLDAPLGWPDAFVDAVARHHDFDGPPGWDVNRLRYRETDRFVYQATGQWPLSVSADRIGGVAMRAAELQVHWARAWGEPAKRDGSGNLVEVYPRAAIDLWNLRDARQPYKGGTTLARRNLDRGVRASILEHLSERASWLEIDAALGEACVASDDVLDALVSALVAYASKSAATTRPNEALAARSAREGWIHLPVSALDQLTPEIGTR